MAINILNIPTYGLWREGITTSQLEFARHMDNEKIRYTFAAVNRVDPDIMEEFRSIGCDVAEFPNRKRNIAAYFFALCNFMRKGHFDILHVHGSSSLMSLELLAGKLCGIPVRIAHSRGTQSGHRSLDTLLRWLFYRLYTDAFACGHEAGEFLFGGRPFTTIYNGKDLNKFRFEKQIRQRIREKNGWADCLLIGHVGTFSYQKNHEFVLEIFREMFSHDPNCRLCLMGGGDGLKRIQSLAVKKGLSEFITFTGRISNVNEMLQAMDIMVFPSRYEGLPNVVLEWQAMGLPSLISDKITRECAVSNLVEFKSLDDGAKQWADKAFSMFHKAECRETAAKKGTEALREAGFDIEQTSRELAAIYENLVKKRK